MKAAVATLVATILGIEGDVVSIDKGLIDGVRPGDAGRVFYTLRVSGREHRIETGVARVLTVDDTSARVEATGDRATPQAGYSVRFEIPAERTTPDALFALARERREEAKPELALLYLERVRGLRPGDRLVEAQIADATAELGRTAETAVRGRHLDMVLVGGGKYPIGLDVAESDHSNQSPRFEAALDAFWIDREPVETAAFERFSTHAAARTPGAPPFATGMTFAEAAGYCASLEKRLPTELEWEAAATTVGLSGALDLNEWTASWYRPYPGNERSEPEYGEQARVLRRPALDHTSPSLRSRRFMAPAERKRDVGFRCARAATAADR
jgi:formylglycine-generating enzyme required for sulfatase activity